MPADRNERTSIPASASPSSPESTALKICMPRPLGASAARLHFDIIQSRTAILHGLREQIVARSERIEHHVPVAHEVLAALVRDPDRIREDLEWKSFGAIGKAVAFA